MTLIPLVVFVLFAVVQHGEVMLGLIDLTESKRAHGVQSWRQRRLLPAGAHAAVGAPFARPVPDAAADPVPDPPDHLLMRHLQSQLRAVDGLARRGGEEALFPMTGTGLHGALIVLERLRGAIDRSGRVDVVAPALTVTFSAGLTQKGTGKTRDVAIARADRVLYQAKESGRDRVAAV